MTENGKRGGGPDHPTPDGEGEGEAEDAVVATTPTAESPDEVEVEVPVDDEEPLDALLGALEGAEERSPDDATAQEPPASESEPDEPTDASARIEALFARVEDAASDRERVLILREIAGIYETDLANPEQAYETMKLAFELDYSDEETAAELEHLATATRKWDELITACNAEIGSLSDTRDAVALCLRIGRWYAEFVGHPEYALPCYGQVLALDPSNETALRRTAELYRRASDWGSLAQVLERHSAIATDAGERKEILLELGSLFEDRLERAEDARRIHHAVLDLDATNEQALTSLERTYRASGSLDPLVRILERRFAGVADAREAAEIGCRIGQIYAEHLDQPQKAIDAYRAVLERDERSVPALKGLAQLFEREERWRDLVSTLEKQAEVGETERERVDALLRMAEVQERQLVQLDVAALTIERALEMDEANDRALGSLEFIYRSIGRWNDLVETLERHIEVCRNRADLVVLHGHLGEIHAEQLDEPDAAIEAYEKLLRLAPENAAALQALAELYRKTGKHAEALRTMERLSRQRGETERAALEHEQGVILLEQMRDLAGAREHFERALEIQPAHLPSVERLREIHVRNRDWDAAAKALEREVALLDTPRKSAKALCALGQIAADHLHAPDRALAHFEAALAADEENEEAARWLAERYAEDERWEDASRLVDGLAFKAAKHGPEEHHKVLLLQGTVSLRVGDRTRAHRAFDAAYALRPDHLPTMRALADLLFESDRGDEAARLYETALVHQRDEIPEPECVELFHRLGTVALARGDRREALRHFGKGLALDRRHRRTLESIISTFEEEEDWERVVQFRQQLVDTLEGEELHDLLVANGDVLWSRLGKDQEAVACYSHALQIRPDDHLTLHKLLEIHTAMGQWQRVVAVILRIAKLEEDPATVAKYFYTIASVYRNEIRDADLAVQYYNAALDKDPDQLKAFEKIDTILTELVDWPALEVNYRRMIQRITGGAKPNLEAQLWNNLGEIYRTRLHQLDAAAESYRRALEIDPHDESRHEVLAGLYVSIPGREAEAIREHQHLLLQNPLRIDCYQALYGLYMGTRSYDKAWCVSAVLSFLGKADIEQRKFFQAYRTTGLVRVESRIDNERWVKDLFHPSEDVLVGKIFEVITPAVRTQKVRKTSDYGLRPKERHDPATDPLPLARLFGYLVEVLSLPLPHLYVRPGAPGGLEYAITDPPATTVGADLVARTSPLDVTFLLGRHLAYYRGEHYVRRIVPTAAELRTLFLAALRLGAPSFAIPSDPAIDQTAAALGQTMTPVAREALTVVCDKMVAVGTKLDLGRWTQAVDLTACRAGLLVCNDLEVATRLLREETPALGDLPVQDKVKQLLLFAVSDGYFRLRELLGIHVRE